MSKTYIYDSNGNVYYFKRVPFKKSVQFQKEMASAQSAGVDATFDKTLEIFKEVFKDSNPDYPGDIDNDIIEYNYGEIGIQNLINLMEAVLKEVFRLEEANTNKYPFLPKNQPVEK